MAFGLIAIQDIDEYFRSVGGGGWGGTGAYAPRPVEDRFEITPYVLDTQGAILQAQRDAAIEAGVQAGGPAIVTTRNTDGAPVVPGDPALASSAPVRDIAGAPVQQNILPWVIGGLALYFLLRK